VQEQGNYLHHDFPFLADISKKPPPAASSAVQPQPTSACHSNVHAVWADGGVSEGISRCNVLLGNPYVLYPKLGSSLLL